MGNKGKCDSNGIVFQQRATIREHMKIAEGYHVYSILFASKAIILQNFTYLMIGLAFLKK